MLRQRVVTALALAAFFLAGILFLPIPALAGAFALVVVLGAWEWAPMAGWHGTPERCIYAVVVLALCILVYIDARLGVGPTRADVQPYLGIGCLWWCFALLWVRSYPNSAVLWNSRPVRSLMGCFVLVPAWLAAVYLLTLPLGGAVMVVLVLLVAAADIGAFFTGKSIGRHRLAAQVSPAKTWEGFWGGVFSAALVGTTVWLLLPMEYGHVSLSSVLTVAICTALASVLGDLTVSMVKRASGVKDSGGILPGHGGLLDRLDSLCGAAPTFALGLLLSGV